MSLKAAFEYVRLRRPAINPNRGFLEQLIALETSIYARPTLLYFVFSVLFLSYLRQVGRKWKPHLVVGCDSLFHACRGLILLHPTHTYEHMHKFTPQAHQGHQQARRGPARDRLTAEAAR
jgi:hypothetical protein